MVHENYPENILKQYSGYSFLEIIDVVENISDRISESDKIDGMIFTNQYWTLQNSHGFYSCVLPSFYANYLSSKNQAKYNIIYTKDFNRTSIKHNNCKYIRKLKKNSNLKNYKINDILQLGFILKQLSDLEYYDKIIEFGNQYLFSRDDIVKIIKINKMIKYNITYSCKIKQFLESSLIVKSKKEKKEDDESFIDN